MTPEERRERARKGGLATANRYGAGYMRRLGYRGGVVVWLRHGSDHMSKIGKEARERKGKNKGQDV